MEGITFFGSGNVENIKSVGLVFGPNFFTAYFYSDYDATLPIGYLKASIDEKSKLEALRDLMPVYAVSFCTDWTLMPQDIFKETDALAILNFNTTSEKTAAKWNRIIGLDAIICSEPDKQSADIIEHVFPGIDVKHGVGTLLEYCRKDAKTGPHVYLHQAGNRFTIAVFDNHKLKLANSFDGRFEEDVRYFVLYAMKQLNIDSNTPFILLGEAATNPSIREILGKYLSQINWPSLASNQIESHILSEETHAEHWLGLNASLCAL